MSWEDESNYLCIDRSKKREQGRYCNCNENRNTYTECFPETKLFRSKKMLKLNSKKDREGLEKIEELASLQNQIKDIQLQDKSGKQNFHEELKKVFELVTKSLETTSQDITKNITENSIKNNKAVENLNTKLLEIMKDRGIKASYLMSPLSRTTNLLNTSQFKFVKSSNLESINKLMLKNTITFTL